MVERALILEPACPRCGDPGYRDVLGRRHCGNSACDHIADLPQCIGAERPQWESDSTEDDPS